MNYKTTLLLLIFVLGLGVVWLLSPGQPRPGTEPDPADKPPPPPQYVINPAVETNSILGVTIARPGKTELAFAREVDTAVAGLTTNWRMTAPYAAEADRGLVDRVASTFGNLQSQTRVEPGAANAPKPADIGLEPPIARVTLRDKAGVDHTIEVGKTVPASKDTYVRVAGQPTIYVVPSELATQLNKEAADYQSKRLIPFQVDKIIGLTIASEGRDFELSRGADKEWGMVQPARAFADGEKVRKLLADLTALRAESFAAADTVPAASTQFDQPYLTIKIVAEEQKPVAANQPATSPGGESETAAAKWETIQTTRELLVGGPADLKGERRFVTSPGQSWIGTLRQSELDKIAPTEAKLRDARITRVKMTDVNEVRLKSGSESTGFKKSGGYWVGEGDLDALDIPAVTDFLEAFEDLAAVDFIKPGDDRAKFGLEDPRATVEVVVAGQPAPVTLKIGADTSAGGRNTYVQRVGDPTVFVVKADQAKRLAVTPLGLRSRTLFSFPFEQISEVELARPDGKYIFTRHGAEGWKFNEPAGAPVEGVAVSDVARDLARLTAKTVVAKDDFGRYGLEPPLLTAAFTVNVPAVSAEADSQPAGSPASKPVRQTVRFGRANNIGYAAREGDPYIYQLDETVWRVLNTELISTALFDFKPDDVVGFSVVAPGGTLELTRDKDKWVYAPDPYVEIAPAKVRNYLDELAKTRAERWIAWQGGDLAAAGFDQPDANVAITLKDGRKITLLLRQEAAGQLPLRGSFPAEQRIFRMRKEDVEKLLRGIDQYAKSDKPEPAADQNEDEGGMPPMNIPPPR